MLNNITKINKDVPWALAKICICGGGGASPGKDPKRPLTYIKKVAKRPPRGKKAPHSVKK